MPVSKYCGFCKYYTNHYISVVGRDLTSRGLCGLCSLGTNAEDIKTDCQGFTLVDHIPIDIFALIVLRTAEARKKDHTQICAAGVLADMGIDFFSTNLNKILK